MCERRAQKTNFVPLLLVPSCTNKGTWPPISLEENNLFWNSFQRDVIASRLSVCMHVTAQTITQFCITKSDWNRRRVRRNFVSIFALAHDDGADIPPMLGVDLEGGRTSRGHCVVWRAWMEGVARCGQRVRLASVQEKHRVADTLRRCSSADPDTEHRSEE